MKVSALPADQQLNLTDRVLIDDEGGTKTATIQQISDAIGGGGYSPETKYDVGAVVTAANGFIGVVGQSCFEVNTEAALDNRLGIHNTKDGSVSYEIMTTNLHDVYRDHILSVKNVINGDTYSFTAGTRNIVKPIWRGMGDGTSYVYLGQFTYRSTSNAIRSASCADNALLLLLDEDLYVLPRSSYTSGIGYYNAVQGTKYHIFMRV